jgi:hypothetical protein
MLGFLTKFRADFEAKLAQSAKTRRSLPIAVGANP